MTTEEKQLVNDLWALWEKLAEHGEIYIGHTFSKKHSLLEEKVKAINYSRCCKPKGNCKITVLVTYEIWQDSGSAYFDDYKVTRNKILQVENLEDLNEIFTNLVDIKILK